MDAWCVLYINAPAFEARFRPGTHHDAGAVAQREDNLFGRLLVHIVVMNISELRIRQSAANATTDFCAENDTNCTSI
jgi:hypothetical protein